MHLTSFLLGISCCVAYTWAQLPQLPTAFAGASPAVIEGSRPIQIRRPVSRSRQNAATAAGAPPAAVQSDSQTIRPIQRRPVVRARANIVEDEKPYIRNNIEELQKPRITSTTPQPQPAKLTPRPVNEDDYYDDEEVDDASTTQASISRAGYAGPFHPQTNNNPLPAPFQRPAFVQPSEFRPSPILLQQQQQPSFRPTPIILPIQQSPTPTPIRHIPRPQITVQKPVAIPSTRPPPQQLINEEEEEEEEEDEPQYTKQQPRPVQQYRPAQPVRQPQQQQVIQQKPVYKQHPLKASPPKEKKPVAQTIRKYHVENEDGSITWGYENDDGSFKEETIGVDCVTRGKYGYVDPDGVKREYTYQTGIPCDKEAEEAEQAASANEGYIDYTNNRYVFPNGDEIDLDAMVKNRARKPVGKYRN